MLNMRAKRQKGEAMNYNGKELRLKENMTQEELSQKSGVARSIINGLESGRTETTTTKTLLKIARALEVGVADLFSDATA